MAEHRRFRPRFEPKSRWRYIFLLCGGITTPDEQEFFAVWKTKELRGKYWCTLCQSWQMEDKRNFTERLANAHPCTGPNLGDET